MFDGGVWEHIFEHPSLNHRAAQYIDELPLRADIRLAALLLGDANAEKHLATLKTSLAFSEHVKQILHCVLPESDTLPALRRTLYHYGAMPSLDRALIARNAKLYARLALLCEAENCFSVRDLAVTGGDVLAHTSFRGKAIGEALETVLFAVFDEKIPNTREAELEYLCAIR